MSGRTSVSTFGLWLWVLVVVVNIVCITQPVACQAAAENRSDAYESESSSPPTPVFIDNYHVKGLLSLPYAELNEPFEAWFDNDKGKSRTDYYGDLYKIYQFAPRAANNRFGTMYKLTYVPADFHPNYKRTRKQVAEGVFARLAGAAALHNLEHSFDARGHSSHSDDLSSPASKTPTRRACFAANGGVGLTIVPQTVLPDLRGYAFEGRGPCPAANLEHRHSKCELWKKVNEVGEKKNTYKFWLKRQHDTGELVPVHFYMLGYDSMLGSHYDRYDISYFDYKPNAALESDFEFDAAKLDCGPMPGPGDGSDAAAAAASEASLRSHRVLSNPIHEYVDEPHRYDHIDYEFGKFAEAHSKAYENERRKRESWHNFLHNFRFINSKNRELKEFKLKVNRYADNKPAELGYLRGRLHSRGYNGGLDYAEAHRGAVEGLRRNGGDGGGGGASKSTPLPESWDWTRRGAVTPVKDQAVCGSCWSFGTSGTIEGAYFVKTGKLVRLSQQQMVDCSWEFGNNGCDGGEDFRAYKYIEKAGGLASEEDYGRYMGVDGKCHDRDVPKTVKIKGFYNVTVNNVDALKHAVYTYGPVTVAIDASQPTFTFYSHGVYYDPRCHNSPDELDHQVLVVGYTHIDGKLVWIVKNSWSTYWGDDGYIMMAAKDNNCGLMDAPTVPIIDGVA